MKAPHCTYFFELADQASARNTAEKLRNVVRESANADKASLSTTLHKRRLAPA